MLRSHATISPLPYGGYEAIWRPTYRHTIHHLGIYSTEIAAASAIKTAAFREGAGVIISRPRGARRRGTTITHGHTFAGTVWS